MAKIFVLMPFSGEFRPVYDNIIRGDLSQRHEVARADDIANQRNVLHDIIEGIVDADVVIADLTGLNANVMYELGLAHTMLKPTILLTQAIQTLPFDLRSYRAVEYLATPEIRLRIPGQLVETVAGIVSGSLRFGNPVSDYALSRNTPLQLIGQPNSVQELPSTVVDEMFDRATEDQSRLRPRLHTIGSTLADIQDRITLPLSKVASARRSFLLIRQQRLSTSMNQLSAVFVQGSAALESAVAALASDWRRYAESMMTLLTSAPAEVLGGEKASSPLIASFRDFEAAFEMTVRGAQKLEVTTSGAMGLSRVLDESFNQFRKALQLLWTTMETMRADVQRMRRLAEDRKCR